MRTYTGITNDIVKRLRQHNREIAGGANATANIYPLAYFLRIKNLTKSEALSIERRIHIMKRKKPGRYCSWLGSLRCVADLADRKLVRIVDVEYLGVSP